MLRETLVYQYNHLPVATVFFKQWKDVVEFLACVRRIQLCQFSEYCTPWDESKKGGREGKRERDCVCEREREREREVQTVLDSLK